MKKNFSISLKNRLALTYAFFISLTIGILILLINIFTTVIFDNLVRENITSRNTEIVSLISEQYNQGRRSFDTTSLRAIGLYFAQQGYLVALEDERGNLIWDARSILPPAQQGHHNSSMRRMGRRGGNPGMGLIPQTHREHFPVNIGNIRVGTVSIETLAPVFYSETEFHFLSSLNRILLIAWIVLTLLSVMVSVLLSRTIAKPILKAGDTARRIALAYNRNTLQFGNNSGIRINEQYRTREIAELSGSINSLAEELEEGERRQRQLSNDIAHELRTPLATLQGSLEAMIDGIYTPDKVHLESCHEEILRLNRLVDDLNLLTGLEWKNIKLNLSEINLGKLIDDLADQWKPAILEKGLELKLFMDENRDYIVSGDYDRLKQVFINLISNAVKYTDRGYVSIKLDSIPLENSIMVSIIDTGIGIPKEDLPHVFERFYRSDKSRSRSTGGAGIGLSIAAAIIYAHGGKISVDGNNGNGTVFHISLKTDISQQLHY